MLTFAATIPGVHYNLISFGSIYQPADDDLPSKGLQECIQILSNGLLTRVHLKSWQCHLTLLKEYVKRRYGRNTDKLAILILPICWFPPFLCPSSLEIDLNFSKQLIWFSTLPTKLSSLITLLKREPGARKGRKDTQLHPFHICIQVTTMRYVCQFLLMCTCLVFCSAHAKFAQCCLLRLELWRARIPTKVQQLQFLYFDITRLELHWLVNICSCILVFCHGYSISFRQTLCCESNND